MSYESEVQAANTAIADADALIQRLSDDIDKAEKVRKAQDAATAMVDAELPKIGTSLDNVLATLDASASVNAKVKNALDRAEADAANLVTVAKSIYGDAGEAFLKALADRVDKAVTPRVAELRERARLQTNEYSKYGKALAKLKKFLDRAEDAVKNGKADDADTALGDAKDESSDIAANIQSSQFEVVRAHFEAKLSDQDARIPKIEADIAALRASGAKPKPSQTSPSPAPASAPSALPPGVFPDSIAGSGMKVVSDKIGGTTGAKLVEIDGRRYILKTAGKVSPEHVRSEATADQAYRRAGIRVPDCRIYEEDGKTYKLSEFIAGGQSLRDYMDKATPAQKKAVIDELKQGYIVDSLFANWDVLGTDQDNVLIDKDGHAWRIDNGSSFGFRAQGSRKKPEEWDKREWPDEWRTLRTSSINSGVFDQLTAHDIFSSKVDLDAVAASLPPDVQQSLAKPLEELKQMQARCANNDRGGFLPAHTSDVLERSYDWCKSGIREKIATILHDAGKTHIASTSDIPLLFRSNPSAASRSSAADPMKISNDILAAAKSINHHWQDKNVNMEKVKLALSHKSQLEQLAATDKNAATMLGFLTEIDESAASKWQKPVSKSVPVLPISVPKSSEPEPSRSLTEEVIDFVSKNGDPSAQADRSRWEFIRSAQSDQGGCSWSGDACKMKILSYDARGIEWDPSKTPHENGEAKNGGAMFGNGCVRREYEAMARHYASHPAELAKDRETFRSMKAALQVIFENLDIEGKTPEGDFIVCRTETDESFARSNVPVGKFGSMPSASCESTASFRSVFTGDLTIRRLPLSRMNGTYLLGASETNPVAFFGDGENEVTFDINGRDILVYNAGRAVSGTNLKAKREEFLKAEAALKASQRR